MTSLLNSNRPPAFCPGCSHERSLHALDRAFQELGLQPHEVVMVSDIGCSGLFDTFFATHAFHGLHGRALTYAAGLKLARPQLKVVVTMGDGGLGIGGAHFLEACRRNLDLTLLVLNNFNFGMTGGQFSCTTPAEASVTSGFLNTLEKPMDICRVAAAAGAPFAARCSVYQKDLPRLLVDAIGYTGFSVVDIWGACTGYYSRRNPLSPRDIELGMKELPFFDGPVAANLRREYGSTYRETCSASGAVATEWQKIEAIFPAPVKERREIVLLGAAGDRIISAGSLLAHAAILGGMQVTQKNDYDITVMRGPSVSELILSPEPILYTGVEQPDVIVALAPEGIMRKRELFAEMSSTGRVFLEKGLEIPDTAARTMEIDFKGQGIKRTERALAALSLLGGTRDPITSEMLERGLRSSLKGEALEKSLALLARAAATWSI
jgi:2-oxoglutarate/2-oxoacid ferredoxin oxidoreductase subunit beta